VLFKKIVVNVLNSTTYRKVQKTIKYCKLYRGLPWSSW